MKTLNTVAILAHILLLTGGIGVIPLPASDHQVHAGYRKIANAIHYCRPDNPDGSDRPLGRPVSRLATGLLVTFASGCATRTLWQRTFAFEWRPDLVYKVMPFAPIVVFSKTADVHSPYVFTRKVGWQVGHPLDDVADKQQQTQMRIPT